MFRVEDNKNNEYMKKILMITMMVVAAVAMHAQLPNVQLKDVNGTPFKQVPLVTMANL